MTFQAVRRDELKENISIFFVSYSEDKIKFKKLTQIEETEELISWHLIGIPYFSRVNDQNTSTQMVFVLQHIHNISLDESMFLIFRK